MTDLELYETIGYKTAIAFKPFIDPKCSEHMEIIKDMAKAINNANRVFFNENQPVNKDLIEQVEQLTEKLHKIVAFENMETVHMDGLTYRKAINENSFYTSIIKSVK